jgi:hypothetical protein
MFYNEDADDRVTMSKNIMRDLNEPVSLEPVQEIVAAGPDINFRFKEDEILAKLTTYIESTYAGHYVGNHVGMEDKEVQTIDVWRTLGSLGSTSRDTALKYLMRYGKKGGHNEKDMLKAMHYVMLLWFATQYDGESIAPEETTPLED